MAEHETLFIPGVPEETLSYIEDCFEDVFGVEAVAKARAMRRPSEYMRPGMSPWTTAERAYVDEQNEEAGR